MKMFIYGYGSLINLKSASLALKRELTKNEIKIGKLKGYERNWTLWDNVISNDLNNEVKGVFLNIARNESAYLNGVLFEVNDEELSNFKTREKNYSCIEITDRIEFDNDASSFYYRVFTFVGKNEYLITPGADEYFIFSKYIESVHDGVKMLGSDFLSVFNKTTKASDLPRLAGTYRFINSIQDSLR